MAGLLSPLARENAFNLGQSVPGALLYTWAAGQIGVVPRVTYSDSVLSVPNANPLVADASGLFGPIYLTPGLSYGYQLCSPLSVVVWSQDNVAIGASSSDISTAVAAVIDTGLFEFRLTLSSGSPVPPADVTAATTLYCTPYVGNRLALYDALGVATIYTSAQFSIALPAVTSTNYDVFAYASSGTPTLELLAWRNSGQAITGATNATPIVITANTHGLSNGDQVYVNSVLGNTAANGTWTVANKSANTFELSGSVGNGAYTASSGWLNARASSGLLSLVTVGNYCKTGDLTRRFVGSVRIGTSSGQSEDSATKRQVFSYYNRVTALLAKQITGANYSVPGGGAYRQVNGDTANQVEAMVGVQEMTVRLTGTYFVINGAAENTDIVAGMAEDITNNITNDGCAGRARIDIGAGTVGQTVIGTICKRPVPGYHTYPMTEVRNAGASNTVSLGVGGAGIFGMLEG